MTALPDALPLSPRTTSELVGHQSAEKAFLDAWQSGRLAHAWLITGPRGIGKATLAYRIARFALAGGNGGEEGLFGAPPPPVDLALKTDHQVFRRVASGGHADLKVIERSWTDDKKTRLKSDIPVDDVRGIGAFLSLTPAEGGWRVVIVDAVDDLNRSGANAILKTLEEPPRNALLLLVSHSPGRLLPTIRSRCRRLALQPLDEPQVIDLLAAQRPDLAEADVHAIARLAGGSIGKALALAEEGGVSLYREMVAVLGGFPRLDIAALYAFGEKVAKGDEVFRTFSELFTGWLAGAARRAACAGADDGGNISEVVPGEGALQQRFVAAAGLDRWVEVWEKTNHTFGRADAVNLDRKLVAINAFLALERLVARS